MRISSCGLALIVACLGCHRSECPTSPVSPGQDGVTARVDHVEASLESVLYWRVFVAFENHGATCASVECYRLVWNGGSQTVETHDFSLAAGATQTRSARVYTTGRDFESTVRVEPCR